MPVCAQVLLERIQQATFNKIRVLHRQQVQLGFPFLQRFRFFLQSLGVFGWNWGERVIDGRSSQGRIKIDYWLIAKIFLRLQMIHHALVLFALGIVQSTQVQNQRRGKQIAFQKRGKYG